ncbi:MAG TPA: methyltransferase domain-containing protein [Candidatus Methylomirabilis sp.]|nr:methyltransferase domain-containing protein [Candidatus Methylomirabilis sp.]
MRSSRDSRLAGTPPVQGTSESFGLEWTAHGDLSRLYASETDLWREFETFRIPSDLFEGKRVLDAGCGMGRWSYAAAKSGASQVVAFDLHDGVHAAKRLTRDMGQVSLLKANIFTLPFREECFDSIISIGVLHHTGDTSGAIRALLPLLRPGGRVFIQLYETRGETKDRRMAALLRLTNRVPKRLLYRLCVLLAAGRYVPVVKNVIQAANHFVQIVSFGKHRTFWRNVADTYDWHCCPYRTFHTAEELRRLFADLGLIEVAITNPDYRGAVNIVGRRPAASGTVESPLGVGTWDGRRA